MYTSIARARSVAFGTGLLVAAIVLTASADTFEQRRQRALDAIAAMPLTGDGNHKAKSGVYIAYDGRKTSAFSGVDTDRQKIDGERVVYGDWPRLGSPWASSEVGGRHLTVEKDGLRRVYDFEQWETSRGG